MSKKNNNYLLTNKLARKYQKASFENAESLLLEAQLLLDNNFVCRAYFLACASIEETGKAFILFNSQGRNLKDGAIQNKVKNEIENHSSKISSALHAWIFLSDKKKETILEKIDLGIGIEHGREPSMYVDVSDQNEVVKPSALVKKINAKDIVLVARECLEKTKKYTSENIPPAKTSHEDKFYCMSRSLREKIQSLEDFSDYYLENMTSTIDIEKHLVTYNESYFQQNKLYKKK